MTITLRSVGIGLAAWGLAFAVVYFGRLNPLNLGVAGAVAILLSAVVGFSSAVGAARRLCTNQSERAGAVASFAIAWFVGIFSPISAVWACFPFFSWLQAQEVKPKSYVFGPLLVVAIERTAVSYYLGLLAVAAAGWLIVKRKLPAPWRYFRNSPPTRSVFTRDDILLSTMGLVFISAFVLAKRPFDLGVAKWIGLLSAWFLICFLVRSVRLHWSAADSQLANSSVEPLPVAAARVGGFVLAVGWLALPMFLSGVEFSHEKRFWVFTGLAFLMWLAFNISARKRDSRQVEREHLLGTFALRIGWWGGIGFSGFIAAMVLKGIANSELGHAATPTPFAYTVIALEPFLYAIAPIGAGLSGAVFIPLLFRKTARAHELIAGCAQGGFAAAVSGCVILVFFAMNLAECMVGLIPTDEGISLDTAMKFTPGGWVMLSRRYMAWLLASCLASGIAWAYGTAFGCAVSWTWKRIGGEKLEDWFVNVVQQKFRRRKSIASIAR